MTTPTEFPDLVTDFEVDWDTPGSCGHEECAAAFSLAEDEHYEHGFVNFENGYAVSLMRAKKDDYTSAGYEDGLWEATVGVEANPLIKMILGMEFVPSLEAFEALGLGETGIAESLDNAGVNEFLGRVAALPQAEKDEVGVEDLGGLFE